MENKEIILASSSPRRIEIMRNHGFEPTVIAPETDESLTDELNEKEAVMYLALKKALAVEKALSIEKALAVEKALTMKKSLTMEKSLAAEKAISVDGLTDDMIKAKPQHPPLIIAADTIVFKDRIIGKPKDLADALNIFEMLRATSHEVITGVAILEAETTNRRIFYERSQVYFKDYTQEEIRAYLNTDEPWDKAGGYAIQGTFAKYVDHYEGDLENIIGFPWTRIEQELKYFTSLVCCLVGD